MNMRIGLAVLSLLSVVVWPSPSMALLMVPLLRELTPEEALEHAVSQVDVILVGNIEGIVDSMTPDPQNFPYYMPDQHLVVRSVRWLKGSPIEGRIRIGVGETSRTVRHLRAQNQFSGKPLIFFVRLVGPREAKSFPGQSLPPSWHGYLYEEADILPSGVWGLDNQSIERHEHKVKSAVKRTSIDSLATAADAVVLGTNLRIGARCKILGRDATCTTVQVEEVLAGSVTGQRITVYSIIPGGTPKQRGLLFLKQMPGGAYEIFRFGAGGRAIKNGTVGREKDSLNEILDRVRVAALARPDAKATKR
jgi:hypothetical protein